MDGLRSLQRWMALFALLTIALLVTLCGIVSAGPDPVPLSAPTAPDAPLTAGASLQAARAVREPGAPVAIDTPTSDGNVRGTYSGPAPSEPQSGAPSPIRELVRGETCPEVPQPHAVTFRVSPDERLDAGDTVTVAWATADATHVTLCYRYRVGTAGALREAGGECATALPPVGSRTMTLVPHEASEVFYVHFALSAVNGVPSPEEPNRLRCLAEAQHDVYVPLACSHAWFVPNPPRWCPLEPAWSVPATAQSFQGGTIVHIPSQNGIASNAVIAYLTGVAQGTPRYRTFMNATPQDPGAHLVPPEGQLRPDSISYPVWMGTHHGGFHRGTPPLRGALGWAVGPPIGFEYVYQCTEGPDTHDPCYASMPDGAVSQIRPHEGVWTVWQ